MKHRILASISITALAAAPAMAEEPLDLGAIVLSPSLSPVSAARTGATVEVIEDEELQNTDTTLRQTLSRQPGVSYSANGGVGTNTTLRIRGLDTNYIGVRINGIDVADPSSTQTSFNFGGLTSAGLGRVEVLKGSQSAIYGSEAIGGVIDITTMRARGRGPTTELNLEFGSFDTYSGSFGYAYGGERGEVAMTYSRFRTEGISARAGDTEKDGYDSEMLTATAEYDLTDGLTLGAALLWRDGTAEVDRSTTDNRGTNLFAQRGARAFARFETGAVQHELAFSAYQSDRQDPGGFTTSFLGERETLEYRGSAPLNAGLTLNFGADRTEESFALPGTSGDVTTHSVFTEALYAPSDTLDLSLALRHDDHSMFGGSSSGRLAAAWRATPDWTVRAVLGTGFRAPSLYELYGPFGSATLQPEESRSFELGVERDLGAGSIRATAFYTEIDNLIQYDFTTSAYNQVPGTTTTKGLELAGTYDVNERYSLFGNYTLTDAENNGARLVRVPRHDLVLGVEADLGRGFGGMFEVQQVVDVVPSAFAPAGNKVGDYTLVNLGVTYDVSTQAQAYMRVENLLDEDYETAGGYNMPGRAAYFGLRASF
ncbi:TonB-dependent receptor [Lutimaribacter sp. EGI FJ00015]|uniref:TonB-dependent receptor n=1 Tax=Lutimaribacter degradans TaxID=2945989 RepID=A0ACC5ZZ16_9RHOB|nr:TonB-dependent receptor [Lutimaribacter sp. EGI FJ00013]MCM2562986.1 TonB-dependent receptor [Lutimaribacter sp. EGI FJ00013]MCO0614154.1 TonB-dependent receptor [Lutimaribacter sp. EGI FJ00015]MCO0636131.1 TonB-dependent receptor [Lutimaribacter sp. EGI FJ00014]